MSRWLGDTVGPGEPRRGEWPLTCVLVNGSRQPGGSENYVNHSLRAKPISMFPCWFWNKSFILQTVIDHAECTCPDGSNARAMGEQVDEKPAHLHGI